MGTRALVHVHDDDPNGTILCTIYRQFDGYPEGLGDELREFISKGVLINGIGIDAKIGTHFNGMGCFAAQLIAYLKNKVGNVYVYAPGTSDVWEEFTYHLWASGNVVIMEIVLDPLEKEEE